MKTVVGLFDTYAHAETAAHDLERAGFSHDDISLVANNTNGKFGLVNTMESVEASESPTLGSETAKGAVAGGVTGLVLGLVAFAIPGFGAIAAAGWLTTALTGVVVGAGIGLVGALSGIGIPHEEAHYYAEGVRRGGTLIAVRAQDEDADKVARILGADGAVNIDERAEQYRREGFVPGAATSVPAPVDPINTAPRPVSPVMSETPAVQTPSPALSAVSNLPDANRQVDTVLYSEHTGRTTSYEAYEEDFRANWRTNYGNLGGRFEDYASAYQYGYDLNNDSRYRGRDWNSAEADIQRDWETRQPGTWDRMKSSIRYAWDRTTGAERGGIQTGGYALDGTPDTRGITEKMADAVTGDRIDDKTGKPVA